MPAVALISIPGARAGQRGRASACGWPRAPLRALSCPLYGVTVDNVSELAQLLSSERALPRRLSTRIVFDVGARVGEYRRAVRAFHRSGYVLGELLDSSEEKEIGAGAEHTRVARYLAAYGKLVSVWEVANEPNGNWTGPYRTVAAELSDAYRQVHGAGDASALTLYANDLAPDHCGDGPAELTPAQFTRRYVPRAVRNGLSYVFISYYEQSCAGVRPSAGAWTRYFRALHALYPRAALGFGEVGLTELASASTLAYAQGMLRYYYGLRVALPYFVGGDFWWYYAEDGAFTSQPLWQALDTVLGQAPVERPR